MLLDVLEQAIPSIFLVALFLVGKVMVKLYTVSDIYRISICTKTKYI